jgi:hypothetical protein
MKVKNAIKVGRDTAHMNRLGGGWVVTTYYNWDFSIGHASEPMPYARACQMVRAHRIQWALIAAGDRFVRPGEAPYDELASIWAQVSGTWEDNVRVLADRLGFEPIDRIN